MREPYIPTTEQIRDGYSIDPEAEYHDPLTNHTANNRRDFARWLAHQETTTRESERHEWADYLEHWGEKVGSSPFTQEAVVAALRGTRPFGTHSGSQP